MTSHPGFSLRSKIPNVAFPITQIMKCSLASSIVPDDWKAAQVTPVRKSGTKYLEVNGLVTETQHGFRKGGSCLSNLLQFLDHATRCINDESTLYI